MRWHHTDWTADQIAQLRRLAGKGWKSEAIGQRLGRSRNSVIGMARRKGIRLIYKQCRPIPDWPVSAPVEIPQAPPPLGGFSLLDLKPGQCRWPSDGDKLPFTFCGAEQIAGSSYCEAHFQRAHQKPHAAARHPSYALPGVVG